jgi:hypothetical protein
MAWLRRLKLIAKQDSKVQLDEVPVEFCKGERIDLSRWSIILTDDNLKSIGEQGASVQYALNGSKDDARHFVELLEPTTNNKHGYIA